MFKNSRSLRTLIGLIIILALGLGLVSCANAGKEEAKDGAENEAGTTAVDKDGENQAGKDENEEDKAGDEKAEEPGPNMPMPSESLTESDLNGGLYVQKFEDAVIYDEGGLKITAIFDGKFDGIDEIWSNLWYKVMFIKAENHTDKPVFFDVNYAGLKDGLVFRTHYIDAAVEPGGESIMPVRFDEDIFCYRTQGLGKYLPEFRLHGSIYDGETKVRVKEFDTAYVKPEGSETAPDYSYLDAKRLILDEGGIKLYVLDHFLTPSLLMEEPEESVYYNINFYYENENDKAYILRQDAFLFNGRADEDNPQTSIMLHAKSKGFEILPLRKSGIDKIAGGELTALTFDARVLDYLEDYTYPIIEYYIPDSSCKDIIIKKGIELDLSGEWKSIK